MSKAVILIVEDDISLLNGIRAILELNGYQVLMAEDGEEALDVMRRQQAPPQVIVSDIMMPNMDGITLLQEVRKEPDWLTIPFIFLTARSEKTDIQRGKRLGVDDYIVKPFETEDLLSAVASRLQRQRALNEAQSNALTTLKRNILTILNHEFRTPLTFVVAYADLLNHHTAEMAVDGEMLMFLKGVESGAIRLRHLIENFIMLVELETGDAHRTYEWRKATITNVEQALKSACGLVAANRADERHFDLHVDENIPQFVGDIEYLTIALTQLVDNAYKFSERDTPVALGARYHEDAIELWVADQGRGIPENELDNIWQSFYQVDRAQHEDQGAGAGLAIVQGIAAMHGGKVAVQSRLGEGSIFTIIIPVNIL